MIPTMLLIGSVFIEISRVIQRHLSPHYAIRLSCYGSEFDVHMMITTNDPEELIKPLNNLKRASGYSQTLAKSSNTAFENPYR